MISSISFVLISFCFFLLIMQSILSWVFFWQEHDFRFDKSLISKVIPHKSSIFSIQSLFILTFFSYGLVIINDAYGMWFYRIVFVVFILGASLFIKSILNKSVQMPIFTFRALLFSVLTLFVISVLYTVPLVDFYLWILLLLFFSPVVIAVFVALFSFPTEIYMDFLFQKAQKKILRNKKLSIILFFGDENAKVTMHYTNRILGKSFFIVRIGDGSSIGITKTILQRVDNKTQIILLSLPSLKKDSIEKILTLLPPTIGIFTGEENKSRKKIFDLIMQQLSKKKYILCAENSEILSVSLHGIPVQNVGTYGIESPKNKAIYASKIYNKGKMTYFQVKLAKEKCTLSVPVTDITNVLPGVFIAKAFGLSFTQIQQGLRLVMPIKK